MKRFLLCLFLLAVLTPYPAVEAADFGDDLVNAADQGKVDEVMRLIKEGESVNSKGEFGVTPLMRAAAQGQLKVAEILLNLGANINAQDEGGATALHLASRQGQRKMVELLLHYDANVNAIDKEGWTPLMRASLAKNSAIVEQLINKGATINQANQFGETALFHASQSGDERSVTLLLGRGADATRATQQGVTPLAIAKRRGHGAVEQLLAKASPLPASTTTTATPAPVTPPVAATAPAAPAAQQSHIAHAEADSWSKVLESVPAPQTQTTAPSRYFLLQLGVAEKIAAAKELRDVIALKQKDILKDKKVEIITTSLGVQKQEVYRVRAGAFLMEDEAKKACAALQQRDIQCFVVESMDVSESMKAAALSGVTPSAAPASIAAVPPKREYFDNLPWLPAQPKPTPAAPKEVAALPPVLPKPAPASTPAQAPAPVTVAAPKKDALPMEENTEIVIPNRMAMMPKHEASYKGLYRYTEPKSTVAAAKPRPATLPAGTDTELDTFIPFASLFDKETAQKEEKTKLAALSPAAAAMEPEPEETTLETLWGKVQFWKEEKAEEEKGLASLEPGAGNKAIVPIASPLRGNPEATVEVEEAVRVPLGRKPMATPTPNDDNAPTPMAFYSSLQPAGGGQWVEVRGFANEGDAWNFWSGLQANEKTPRSAKVLSLGIVTLELGTFGTGEEADSFCKEVAKGGITCTMKQNRSATPFAFLMPAAGNAEGAPAVTPAARDYWLFLGTYADNSTADRYYDRISKAYPAIFKPLGYQVMPPQKGGNNSAQFRLQAGPITSKEEAMKTCETLKKHFVNCAVL